jgi:PIN domain nuclease of toxin-antitoxin system
MSRYLLDTHVWLWMQATPERLSAPTRHLLEDTTNELLLSAASAWEIAIKHRIGKLPLPEEPATYVPDRLRRSGVLSLPVELAHVLRTSSLPDHHQDPFDRVLVAQAQLLEIPIITVDPKLHAYDVETLPG